MPACAPVSETAFLPKRVDGHGRERDGGLLAGGQQHIHLALGGQSGETSRASLMRLSVTPDMAETTTTTLVARLLRGDDAAGDIEDALGVADGGAAIFLDDEAHGGN